MLLEILLFSGAIFYLLVGCCLFTQWLNIMQPDGRIRSGMLVKLFLFIASILWPFIVPFAYLELLPKYKSSKESMGMFAEQVSEGLAVESNA
jgi:hypothetical protein